MPVPYHAFRDRDVVASQARIEQYTVVKNHSDTSTSVRAIT